VLSHPGNNYRYLHLGMIGSNSKSNQTKWYRQLLVHIHNRVLNLRHHLVRSIETGGSRPNNCQAQRPPISWGTMRRIFSLLSMGKLRRRQSARIPQDTHRKPCTDQGSRNLNHGIVCFSTTSLSSKPIATLVKVPSYRSLVAVTIIGVDTC